MKKKRYPLCYRFLNASCKNTAFLITNIYLWEYVFGKRMERKERKETVIATAGLWKWVIDRSIPMSLIDLNFIYSKYVASRNWQTFAICIACRKTDCLFCVSSFQVKCVQWRMEQFEWYFSFVKISKGKTPIYMLFKYWETRLLTKTLLSPIILDGQLYVKSLFFAVNY